jgi:hypothetical protein
MATVRITKELTDAIIDNAKAKFHDSIKKADDSRPGHHWGDYIYDAIYGQYVPIMAQLPAGFIGTINKVLVRRFGPYQIDLYFEFSAPKLWPNCLPPQAPVENHYGNALMLDSSHPVWDDLHAEVKAWKDRCDAARKRSQEFTGGVSKVLENFSTLAPALKEWPPLWELVPEYYKNKHKEITEKRSKADKPAVDKDVLGKLTGAITAAKLGVL